MALTSENRAKFVTSYTRVLITSWSDGAYSDKLDTDPVAALREAGVDLPVDANVEIIRSDPDPAHPDEGGVDAQVELYEEGLRTGQFQFYVPSAPQIPTEQLASGELHGVAAGGVWDPYCCSCCPNCCSASGG